MNQVRELLTMLNTDRRGVTALEYAMIAALIAVAAVGAITGLSGSLQTTLNSISSAM